MSFGSLSFKISSCQPSSRVGCPGPSTGFFPELGTKDNLIVCWRPTLNRIPEHISSCPNPCAVNEDRKAPIGTLPLLTPLPEPPMGTPPAKDPRGGAAHMETANGKLRQDALSRTTCRTIHSRCIIITFPAQLQSAVGPTELRTFERTDGRTYMRTHVAERSQLRISCTP